MGQIIRMPTSTELPPGHIREFVVLLFYVYRKAHRPTLREISDAVRSNDELRGTASPETIRRMLRGRSVPQRWEIVEAVMLTLCSIARISPDSDVIFGDDDDSKNTIRNHMVRLWNEALDYPDQQQYGRDSRQPDLAPVEPQVPDPWAGDDPWGKTEFSDEPPF